MIMLEKEQSCRQALPPESCLLADRVNPIAIGVRDDQRLDRVGACFERGVTRLVQHETPSEEMLLSHFLSCSYRAADLCCNG